jgi:predicted HAD superfamily Cof-like phosphohydrolase
MIQSIWMSEVAESNLFTKGITAQFDKRQRVRKSYGIPDVETRRLLAKLILEEALETVKALGVNAVCNSGPIGYALDIDEVVFEDRDEKVDLLEVIDGCCDTVYVAIGALVACGVPDLPHLEAVCVANDSKFPGGVVKIDPESGKYLKPLGWTPPIHGQVRKALRPKIDMHDLTKSILNTRKVE